MTATDMPPALFDVSDDGDLTPPLLEPAGHGVALTPYGRHHGLGPGIFGHPYCGQAHYGALESSGRRVWIWHACTQLGTHEQHQCDRCDETWT